MTPDCPSKRWLTGLKLPPEMWERATGVEVLIRDGWQDKEWEAPVTRDEFLNRIGGSTCAYPRGFFDQFLQGK